MLSYFLLPAICILLTVLTVSAWQETKLFLSQNLATVVVFFKLSCLLKLFLELLDQTYSWDQIWQQLLVSMSELVSHPPSSGFASDFQPPLHTWYLLQTPQTCLCKKKLPGVNFYRFNAKNWHFWQILRKKVAFFTDLTRKIGVFRCKYYFFKNFARVKQMTNIRYGCASASWFG